MASRPHTPTVLATAISTPPSERANAESPVAKAEGRDAIADQAAEAAMRASVDRLVTSVLPSLMEARPAWAAAGVTWSSAATDVLLYLMDAQSPGATQAVEQCARQLLLLHVTECADVRTRAMCEALLRFIERVPTSEVPVLDALIAATEACLARGLAHLASHLVGDLEKFTAPRVSVPRAQIEKIINLVQAALVATDANLVDAEKLRYKTNDSVVAAGVNFAAGRTHSHILRDMTFASYSLIGGPRESFTWRAVFQLELEFLVANASPFDLRLTMDRVWVVRQKRERLPAFIEECIEVATAFGRVGYFAAAAQVIYAALKLTLQVNEAAVVPQRLLPLYVSFLSAAEGGYESLAAQAILAQLRPYSAERGRLALASARHAVLAVVNEPAPLTQPVAATQRNFVTTVIGVISSLVDEAVTQLGPAPCQFTFVGLGSMAHAAMSLYSDLEFVLVTSEPFLLNDRAIGEEVLKVVEDERVERRERLILVREYITKLIRLVELKVVALGETPPKANVHNVRGLSYDTGGNTPLMKDPPLAGTCEALAEQLKWEAGGDLIVVGVLVAPCFIAGDVDLFMHFEQARNVALGGSDGVQPRVRHGLRLMQEALSFRLHDRLRSSLPFDAKKNIYRMPLLALTALSLLFDIGRTPAPIPFPALIERLLTKGALHPRVAHSLVTILAAAVRLRLGAHGFHGTENDLVAPNPKVGGAAAIYALNGDTFVELQNIVCEHVIPLGAALADYASRLAEVIARRERGSSIELETCTDVTRFFNAGIQEKMAAVTRADPFTATLMAINEMFTRTNVVHTELQEWLQVPVHPSVYALWSKCAYLDGLDRQRKALAELINKAQRVLTYEMISLLHVMEEHYQAAEVTYREADEVGKAELVMWPIQARCCISGVRTLRATAGQALFLRDGTFVKTVQSGLHDVNHRVPGLHFKRDPSCPSIEYAVSLLGFLLNADDAVRGKLTPPVEILRVLMQNGSSHLLLASQTIPGTMLQTALIDNPDLLSKWRPAHFTLCFVLALLICPEDGKPDNFIVVDNLDAEGHVTSIDVVAIDNDHAFVPAFHRKDLVSEQLFIKSIIFCCDQMFQPLDIGVRERLRTIKPAQLLRYWLLALCRSNIQLSKMFTASEMDAALAGGNGPCIPFLMSTPIIKGLYERLSRVVDMCCDEHGAITHFDMLQKVAGKKLALRYGCVVRQFIVHLPFRYKAELEKSKPPFARFLDLTKGSYKTEASITQTLTSNVAMLSNNLGVTSIKGIKLGDPEFSPVRALESLRLIESVREEALVEHAARELEAGRYHAFHDLSIVSLQEKVMSKVRWNAVIKELAPHRRDSITPSTSRKEYAEVFKALAVVEQTVLHLSMPVLGHHGQGVLEKVIPRFALENLTVIDLSYGRFRNWNPLRAKCLCLRTLILRDCCMAEDELVLSEWSDFPSMVLLDITGTEIERLELPNRNVETRCSPHTFSTRRVGGIRPMSVWVLRPARRVVGMATERDELDWWSHGHPRARDVMEAINVSLQSRDTFRVRMEALLALLEGVLEQPSEAVRSRSTSDASATPADIGGGCTGVILRRLAHYNPHYADHADLAVRVATATLRAWAMRSHMYPDALRTFTAVVWGVSCGGFEAYGAFVDELRHAGRSIVLHHRLGDAASSALASFVENIEKLRVTFRTPQDAYSLLDGIVVGHTPTPMRSLGLEIRMEAEWTPMEPNLGFIVV